MNAVRPLIGITAVAVLALTGCSSSGTKSGTPTSTTPTMATTPTTGSGSSTTTVGLTGKITVYAASSLTGTFTTLGKQFEAAHPGTTVTFSFAGSGDLATQITQGAPADVFASAAPKNMTTVVSGGEATSSAVFVKNKAEIAAAVGNPAHIATVADLARRGVKVALCEPTVPCGVVSAAVFANAHVTVKATASEPDVKTTLSQVESGEVDAGVVYVTDVKAAGKKVVGVPIPDAINATTSYPIAALAHSKNPTLAAAFVAFVVSTQGEAVLTAAGFELP